MNNFKRAGILILTGTLTALSSCSSDDATRIEQAEEFAARAEYRTAAIELKNVLRSDPANVDARVLLGKVSLESGDPATAAKELQRARELGALPQDYAVPLARALLSEGRPDAVLSFRPEDLDLPGDRADLNAVIGNAHLQKGDISHAKLSFESALQDEAGNADALVGLARVFTERGDMKAAEDSLRRVIAQDSESHAAYSALGQLQLNSAEYESAEENFTTALLHSDNPALFRERMTYYAGLIDALLAQEKAGEAQDVANKMLALAPEHPYSLFQAARADFEAGRLNDTIDKTQRVVTTFPDYQPARLLLAAAAMSVENFALAEVHLRSVVNADADNARARELLAQVQLSMGNPEEAFKALEPLLDSGSTNPRLLAMAGSASLGSGDRDKGVEYLTRGAEEGSADPAVQIQAATSYIAAGELDKAIELLEQMPESAQGPHRDFLLVLARVRGGDTEGARTAAMALLEQRPDDLMSHRVAGAFHVAVKENKQAREQFQWILDQDLTDTFAVINLAQLDVIEGDLAAASNRYEELLRASPGNLIAMLGLVQVAEKGGDRIRALDLLEDARIANPDAVRPALMLSRHYLRANRLDLAAARAEQALDIAPNNVDAINVLGQIQLRNGLISEALGTFERALRQQPNRVDTHYYRAQTQLNLGMDDAGRESLEKIINLYPTHMGARMTLARIETSKGNFRTALRLAEEVRNDHPDRPEPQALLGDIHFARGHYNDSIKAFDKAADILPTENLTLKRFQTRQRAGKLNAHNVLEHWLETNPDSVRVRVVLGQAYQENGRLNDAVSQYTDVLEKQPGNIVASNNLAMAYAELGGVDNLRRGAEIAARAHEKLPDLPQLTDTYGWLLLQQGKVEEATTKLREAMAQAPDDPEIIYHLAAALHRAGESAEARDLLDSILSGNDSDFGSRDEAQALRKQL